MSGCGRWLRIAIVFSGCFTIMLHVTDQIGLAHPEKLFAASAQPTSSPAGMVQTMQNAPPVRVLKTRRIEIEEALAPTPQAPVPLPESRPMTIVRGGHVDDSTPRMTWRELRLLAPLLPHLRRE